MISLNALQVQGGAGVSQLVASQNMEIILDALLNGPSDNIAVDVRGPILLAPFNGEDTLDGGDPGFNLSRAIKCLTFDYGASFATHPLAGTNIEFRNLQIEADEKAFLFETIDPTTRVNVTDLFNSIVSVCWFGAEARHQSNQIDCHPAFVAAINCFRRSPDTVINQWNFIVRIPATIGYTSFYFLNEPLVIRSSVTLMGDGNLKSYIRFVNSSGITVAGFQAGNTTGQFCTISDLNLSTLYTNPFVSTLNRHGIIANMTCYIEYTTISGFDGDGIHFVTSNNIGRGNLSKITNVNCLSNLKNGIYIEGDDSNNVLFQHISVRDNGACGIREQFSLQNTYINCNAESNSRVANNLSRVRYQVPGDIVRYYICIKDITDPDTQNPNNTTYWKEFTGDSTYPPDIYPVWVNTKYYLMSFAYALSVTGNDSRSVLNGCYAESNQLSIYNPMSLS